MKNNLLLSQYISTPWAVRRDVLAVHAQIIMNWANNIQNANLEHQTNDYDARIRDVNERINASYIAVIPVYGVIVQRAGIITDWCGGTSADQLSNAVTEAANDDSVSDIILDIDSPGGSVYGIEMAANAIYNARSKKNIIAISNSCCASAAYWIGSQASEFYCVPGGEVGSIGVYTVHEDVSQYYENLAVKTTFIKAGEHKTDGNSYEPLTEDAQAFMQTRINDYYEQFTSAVARGRNKTVDYVKKNMGQGRVFGTTEAISSNMIDGIMTFSELINSKRTNQANQNAAKKLKTKSYYKSIIFQNI